MFIFNFNVVFICKIQHICTVYAWPVRYVPVFLLLGGGCPGRKPPAVVFKFIGFLKAPANDGASFLRRRNAPRNTHPFRVPKIRQTVASGHPRPAGASLAGVPAPQEYTSGRPPLRRSITSGCPAPQVHH
jgi:hypothetical protein